VQEVRHRAARLCARRARTSSATGSLLSFEAALKVAADEGETQSKSKSKTARDSGATAIAVVPCKAVMHSSERERAAFSAAFAILGAAAPQGARRSVWPGCSTATR